MVVIEHRTYRREDAEELVTALGAWDADGLHVTGLHSGDLGWHLRSADEVVTGSLHGWWADGTMVAAALLEDDWGARPRIGPDQLRSFDVARAVREVVEGLTAEQIWSDAAPGTAWRHLLLQGGWGLDPDLWVALHRDAATPVGSLRRGLRVARAEQDVEGRVHAQRHGFDGSTFDAPSWERMAAGPGYRPELDLVLHDDDGAACAVATAWLPQGGGTALLEPVAVHRDRRGEGFGRAVVDAAVEACLASGASGVSVSTPESNTGAVAAYLSAKFLRMQTLEGLTRRRSA